MEVVTGISIRDIFQDNNNWHDFLCDNEDNLRPAITDNVLKLLSCRTHLMGYKKYLCPKCRDHYKVIYLSCKSRFCSSCAKKATDEWIAKNNDKLPDTLWQHITFTLPDKYWDLFWLNRDLMSIAAAIAANIIKEIAANRNMDLGIFLVIHTFGRDLKRNYHIHLSVTLYGICDNKIKKIYFDHQLLKNKWKYHITSLLRVRYESDSLNLPKSWNNFNSILDKNYKKKWVVHLGKPSNHKRTVEYLGKYLKRPPIGETRIKNYDGKNVTFTYLDHCDKKIKTFIIPVIDFIKRLISHIPDKYFRAIRYYGILSNRKISRDLPVFNELLALHSDHKAKDKKNYKKEKITFRSLFIKTFGRDPLECPKCKVTMVQYMACYFDKVLLRSLHKQIAQRMV